MNFEQPDKFSIEQLQNFEYRAAGNLRISSSWKSLNIERPEKLEYRGARECWNLERSEKFEYRARRKVKILSSPKTLNIEQPEKFEYRAARRVWISRNRAAVLQNQLLREIASHETPADNGKKSKSKLALSSPNLLYSCYISLANQSANTIK